MTDYVHENGITEKHQKCDKYEKCAVTKFRQLKFKPSCSGNFCYGI